MACVAQDGPQQMYRVKPFMGSNVEVVTNVAMYKVKKYETGLDGVQSAGEDQIPEWIRRLEQRQMKVLQELKKLQEQVQSLGGRFGVSLSEQSFQRTSASAMVGSEAQQCPSPIQSGKLLDLVVSVDPDSPPLSLLILLSQLSNQYQILTNTFTHSSATGKAGRLSNLLQNGAQTMPRSNYQIAVSVVLKKVPNGPQLVVSPTQQTYIEGEVNVARYLARLLNPPYDSQGAVTATQIDEILDSVQQQLISGNNKERAAVLRTLNARLGKSQWLVGSSQSLADVVAWSAVQGFQLASDAPANVKKWLKACAETRDFQTAMKFLSS